MRVELVFRDQGAVFSVTQLRVWQTVLPLSQHFANFKTTKKKHTQALSLYFVYRIFRSPAPTECT